jgi:hypothetical protein
MKAKFSKVSLADKLFATSATINERLRLDPNNGYSQIMEAAKRGDMERVRLYFVAETYSEIGERIIDGTWNNI